MNRILTTHVGSLPRPESLLQLMQRQADGNRLDGGLLKRELCTSVRSIVQRQVDVGIDVVSDGEFSKPSYATYVSERLDGFGGTFRGHIPGDLRDYREFSKQLVATGRIVPQTGGSCCIGPIHAKESGGLQEDILNFAGAIEAARPVGSFMNAASPGVVAVFQKNQFYPTESAYIEAIAEALRPEYEAIVQAGFLLQVDSPDLAMGRHIAFNELDEGDFLKILDRNVVALNHALRNIPFDRVRVHLCWGNYEGPHHRDIPLERIAGRVLRLNVKYLLIEGSNPRHAHEWAVFKDVRLPEDKVVVPGVIDSTSNYVEHPELVAQRLMNYANVVGRERVLAGSDCGFSTFRGYPTVFPDIVWKKLESLVEGARLASKCLWPIQGG